jgi:hypothetical protein
MNANTILASHFKFKHCILILTTNRTPGKEARQISSVWVGFQSTIKSKKHQHAWEQLISRTSLLAFILHAASGRQPYQHFKSPCWAKNVHCKNSRHSDPLCASPLSARASSSTDFAPLVQHTEGKKRSQPLAGYRLFPTNTLTHPRVHWLCIRVRFSRRRDEWLNERASRAHLLCLSLYQRFMHHFAPVPIEKMLVSSGAPLFACRAAVFEEDKRLIR